MIKFKEVSIKYHSSFYSLLNANLNITKSSLVIGDELFTSAFCRTLMNLDKFDGDIFIDDKNIKHITKRNYPIAFIPRVDTFFENQSAEKNIIYSLKLRKFNTNDQKNTINSIKNTYKLNFLDKKMKYLSPAERKLTALLRSIVHNPKYILIENLFETDFEPYHEIILSLIDRQNVIITSSIDVDGLNSFDRIRL